MIDLGTLKIGVTVDKDGANKALGEVNANAEKSNKIFSNLAKVAIGAFSVKAIIGFGKKVVEASADLQAMNAQFDQVFKGEENGQAVERISKQVGDLGINADRLTDSWNKFGGQVKGAGMDSEMALEAVDKATRLAADSAAFYDKSLEDSTGALASFMKGNFSAGDAIGVFTNAKQMDSKANDMYGKSWADLSESERQWLLLDTVEKTYEMNGAMGQASREADSYENVMGNLRATFKSLWAVIGEPVLSVFLSIVQTVTKGVEKFMPIIEETTKNAFDTIRDVVSVVWDWFKVNLLPIFQQLYDWVQGYMPLIQETSRIAFQQIVDVIKVVWDWVKQYILPIFQSMYEWVSSNMPVFQEIFTKAFNLIKDAGMLVWEVFKLSLLPILETLFTWVSDHFGDIGNIITGVFDTIINVGQGVVDVFGKIVDGIKSAIEWVKSWNNTDVKEKQTNLSNNGGGRSIGGIMPLTDIVTPNANQRGIGGTAPTNGGINQTVNIYSPKTLSPSEVANATKKTLQKLVLGF